MAEETDKPSPAKPAHFPTVLLRHDTADGHHFDWLLVNPHTAADPVAKLWTARVEHPSSQWSTLQHWVVEHIGDHRRDYLTYEGPLTGNRGTVHRVDEGTFVALAWSGDRMELDMTMQNFRGILELRRIGGNQWQAHAAPSSRSG